MDDRNHQAFGHGAGSARRSVSPPRRLTAAETEGYTAAKIRGGCAIQTIGMPGGRWLLRAGVVVALAATTAAAWLHEARPRSLVQPAAQTVSTRTDKSQPPALTADEERFATALWAVHREATRSAVAMSFAGIVYQTEDRDARALARKIEPMTKFFHDAEMQSAP
jgi:hypothetical protein